ncbi:MAG: hypothetical protein HFACDABA_01907 [Anaerolineales bacterium]|nr:hypothetical protein [Anaerolineales bacterium]
MKPIFLSCLILSLCLAACASSNQNESPSAENKKPQQTAEATFDSTFTPLPDYTQTTDASTASAADSVLPALAPAESPNAYWVTNPSSGSRLYVIVTYPPGWNGEPIPALVLVPGGIAEHDPNRAARLAEQGFLAISFDPEGRGRSEGVEDYNGHIGQDGLAAIIEAATALPGLDANRYGLVSFSYGVTMATGALARHPDLPIDFYIDWEGPVNRKYSSGCKPEPQHHIQWQPCDNDAWWAEREALTFIVDVQIPYQRVQSQKDHVQPVNTHAIDIVNAAVAGGVPWVRLNEYPAGQTYDAANPPAMLSDTLDRRLEQTLAMYAWQIIENVL